MSTYKGTRRAGYVVSVTVDGEPLNPRNDLFNHSPTGFEWGYGGSGPAQLALAILAHHFGVPGKYALGGSGSAAHMTGLPSRPAARAAHTPEGERAIHLHQHFKWAVVAKLPGEWSLDSSEIDEAIAALEK